MKKNLKKDQQEFYDHMLRYFLYSQSAKQINSPSDKVMFEANTLGGKLIVSLYKEQEVTFTVFSKFEDVNRAAKICTCNPYSGKYNFHSTLPVGGATEQAESFFECIMIKPESKKLAEDLAAMICKKINETSFTETYGRQACLEETIKILTERV